MSSCLSGMHGIYAGVQPLEDGAPGVVGCVAALEGVGQAGVVSVQGGECLGLLALQSDLLHLFCQQ